MRQFEKISVFCRLLLVLLLLPIPASSQQKTESISSILSERNISDFSRRRAETVNQLADIERTTKANAIARARKLNLPIRIEHPGGRVQELIAFEDGKPLYAITLNREAAITTHAARARSLFDIDGAGFTVGVWDAGAIRETHEAFEGRITIRDSSDFDNHATHIGGTIGADGSNLRAHGMSPAVFIDSYDWNSDRSEMTARGATFPGETDKIYLSNHSYGYISGWDHSTGATDWTWHGSGNSNSGVERSFGQYNSRAREIDSLLTNLPYFLPFWAAGNDRDHNPPEGSSVKIGSQTFSYNSAIHPPGDGIYKNGYDTLGHESVAKNLMVVGGVDDAVTAGHRDLTKAVMPDFSSWGPTDDGRIKPDIVANAVGVYSTRSTDDSSYGTSTGTSMATANATGSAQLLISYFDQLFPNHAMRASTLKALIIHTADDLGTPGPDYIYGWGLMNTERAIRQIENYFENPGGHGILESEFQTTSGISGFHLHPFEWDGVSPIRATIAWTDPAGNIAILHDSRTSRLVNDLDLEIIGPDEQIYQPYVMPHVGDWSINSLSAPATTGVNSTDNVEQVFIENPSTPGTYYAKITAAKPLRNNSQIYSLILSGSAPTTAPPPEIRTVSPKNSEGGITPITLSGKNFQTGANLHFESPGKPPRTAFGHEVTTDKIIARIDTSEMENRFWDLVVTNPDGQTTRIPSVFAVGGIFWSENFDNLEGPWETDATDGSASWSTDTSRPYSSPLSLHGTGLETNGIDEVYSPEISISSTAENLELSFRHRYHFSFNHGGVIEFSLDDGDWFDPTFNDSGARFESGSYNNLFDLNLPPNLQNPLGARENWSGDQFAYSKVALALDREIFAGKNLRIRFRIGTDGQTRNSGWWIDDLELKGLAGSVLPAPEITVFPAAQPETVTGSSTNLSALAEDPLDSALTYSWKAKEPIPAPVVFSKNNSEEANLTTAAFEAAGSYLFELSVRNAANALAQETISVEVLQTPAELKIVPEQISVPVEGTFAFSAETFDQFDFLMETEPELIWSVETEAGTISPEGIFTASSNPGGPFLLTVSDGADLISTAEISIHPFSFSDWQKEFFASEELNDPSISGPDADPDGDGLQNLLEYALGSDPTVPDFAFHPKVKIEENELVLTFSRPIDRSDISYIVERSHDLKNWQPIDPQNWQKTPLNKREQIEIHRDISPDDRLFLRLRIEFKE